MNSLVLVLALTLVVYFVLKYLARTSILGGKNTVDNEGSLLLAFYTRGNRVYRLNSGELNGNSYKVFQTVPDPFMPKQETVPIAAGAVIYAIDLDFNTQAHIIGIGSVSSSDKASITQSLSNFRMENVDLEGNFSKYFKVYCAPGQQVQTRYIFNPEAMEAFTEYIHNNCWEVVGDQLYVVGNSLEALVGDDVIAESEIFIKAISPAIKKVLPGMEPVKHEESYGVYDGPVLNCPICHTPMKLANNMHICPENHGVLLSGRELLDLHAGKLKLEMIKPHPTQHGVFKCPYCKHDMQESNYLGGKTVIDSCTNCSFRWLDADEVAAVIPKA